jgi:hypothetical protein
MGLDDLVHVGCSGTKRPPALPVRPSARGGPGARSAPAPASHGWAWPCATHLIARRWRWRWRRRGQHHQITRTAPVPPHTQLPPVPAAPRHAWWYGGAPIHPAANCIQFSVPTPSRARVRSPRPRCTKSGSDGCCAGSPAGLEILLSPIDSTRTARLKNSD